jgi:ribonuclease E
MANKMLIDASHPEETRVVVLRGNRVEEFDFESANKKQLRGNIYLAKVTRVEPSLQAAFVDYGGNRHGFLAFSEIHPDYYQIPVVDRQALIEEEALAHRDEDQDEGRGSRRSRRHKRGDRHGEHIEKRRASRDETIADSGEAELEDEIQAQTPQLSDIPEDAAAGGAHEAWREPADEDRQRGSADEDGDPVESDGAEPVVAAEAVDKGDRSSSVAAPAEGIEPHAASLERGEIAGDDLAHKIEKLAHVADTNGEPSKDGPQAHTDERTPRRLATDPEGFVVVDEEDDPPEDGENSEETLEARFRPERVNDDEDGDEEAEQVEQLGGDAMEEVPVRMNRGRRQYKIQEVIKRRQVLLVQVVKEERGNKGAALTTYLSLAGRYSVLMPNTARGGGISRKITDANDRQRLKAIAQELEVPEGMGVILRTAGAARTKAEVKRDFEYLLRMWETVREMTLKSTAPSLVYEEGSLVKRAIRDLYNKDIDEVTVSGENGYREAKEFMRMLMPSHAKNVQPYREPQPVFARFGVESQLDAMFSNQVTLKSGGYLVINQTEALVAIDVNSGRSTREHNIEDTALRTNLEAADEIARQLRLRDLAGLIVVDFIDMEETRNNRAVERRLKEALKNDRARIQIGRISHFGLLEMSRQRMRTGVLEGSTIVCPHCAGAGTVRSTSSIALYVLRLLEDALIKSAAHNIIVHTRTEVALYILNQKRSNLRDLEHRFGVSLTIAADDSLTGSAYHTIERGEPAAGIVEPPRVEGLRAFETIAVEEDDSIGEENVLDAEAELEGDAEAQAEDDEAGDSDQVRRRRRRRRRRGRNGDRELSGIAPNAPQPSDDALALIAEIGPLPHEYNLAEATEESKDDGQEPAAEAAEGHEPRREGRRRRPRRRRGLAEDASRDGGEDLQATDARADVQGDVLFPWHTMSSETPPPASHADEAASATRGSHDSDSHEHESPATAATEVPPPPPIAHPSDAVASAAAPAPEPVEAPAQGEGAAAEEQTLPNPDPEPDRPKRTGWWQRAKASLGG